MEKITLKELREVEKLLTSLLPKDKEDWKPGHFIVTENLNFVISQLERFIDEKKFEFNSQKFCGALSYIYFVSLKIKRGEYPYLSLEEKDRLKRAKEFLTTLWDAIIEKSRKLYF